MGRFCFFLATALLAGTAHAAMEADSPRAFLQRLYAAYATGGKGNDFAYPEARAIVDDSLLSLLRRDRMMSKGEVGALDGDPICQCQDWERFKVLSMQVEMNGANRARGDVTFTTAPKSAAEAVHFDLVRENGTWKIHDLSWRGTPSFQAYLRDYHY